MVLWYVGFWNDRQTPIFRRHIFWFGLTSMWSLGLFTLLFFFSPIPSLFDVANLDLSSLPAIANVPVIFPVFTIYIILCIFLSLDALSHPGPTNRAMGDLARLRARPWLIGVSITLILVSLIVIAAMSWVVQNTGRSLNYHRQLNVLGGFDIALASLICLAIVLIGQAIVAYEIFTGKTLPRRGLLRYWRNAIILAFGYSAVAGLSLVLDLRPIFLLLLTAVLMTVFYALLSWRSYTERERYIDHLRPFMVSQRLFEQILTQAKSTPAEVDIQTPFNVLCEEVIGAKVAYLTALGPLSAFTGAPLTYPQHIKSDLSSLREITDQFTTSSPRAVPIDAATYGGAVWAVPLWSERGLIGVLLLGEKRDGGLYTQEEIEIAQNTAERLIDNKASAEVAQRLMALQRERLAETQILDQRSRRVLHDDVLQQVHTAMLKLVSAKGGTPENITEAVDLLGDIHRKISDLLHEMPATALPELAKLGLCRALQQLVEEEFSTDFDDVAWQFDANIEDRVKSISPLATEVLYYAAREAIRNAARHGRKTDQATALTLTVAMKWEHGLETSIQDNGVGLTGDHQANDGSGQGLTLHSTMMAVLGGELSIESLPGEYTRVTLTLPAEN
jgi:signal transduction histidine kinase